MKLSDVIIQAVKDGLGSYEPSKHDKLTQILVSRLSKVVDQKEALTIHSTVAKILRQREDTTGSYSALTSTLTDLSMALATLGHASSRQLRTDLRASVHAMLDKIWDDLDKA